MLAFHPRRANVHISLICFISRVGAGGKGLPPHRQTGTDDKSTVYNWGGYVVASPVEIHVIEVIVTATYICCKEA